MYTELMQNPQMDPMTLMAEIPEDVLLSVTGPMLIIFAVLYGVAAGFLSLETRFANYWILDDPKMGACRAVIRSFRLNHRNFWAMIRLDLSFWLYYILQSFALGISMLQLLTPNINLPIPESAANLILYALYGILILAIDWCMRPKIEATYALAYDLLKEEKYPTE